jgi:hypothetical protein
VEQFSEQPKKMGAIWKVADGIKLIDDHDLVRPVYLKVSSQQSEILVNRG